EDQAELPDISERFRAVRRAQRRRTIRRRRAVAIALATLFFVGIGLIVGSLVGGSAKPRRPRESVAAASARAERTPRSGTHGRRGSAAHAGAVPSTNVGTFLGPYGVESSAIISENELPGTTAWKISDPPSTGHIEGFADTTYASVGQKVGIYVSTTAPSFHVVAYRMGWYQGKGARQIWSSGVITGNVQPQCTLTTGINMVSCDNWSLSVTLLITPAFVQGEYLFKLVGSGNEQSYIPVTIWDPNSTAAYLLVSRSLTEEGWNTYGGFSYYQGTGPCTLGQANSYPECNRARVVSFDRPYAEGDGASDFLTNEYPLVYFMEEHGLDASYCTDITLDRYPEIALQHRAILSLGHDETWTYNEREAAQNALNHGVNIAFFGAASVLRHSRLQASAFGPDREEVDYRDEAEDPLDNGSDPMQVTGNTWSSPPASWPETAFVGEVYSGYLDPGAAPVPFVVEDSSAWIFKGTGLHDGSEVPGVIVSDIDHIDPSQSMPTNIQVLGHSPVPLSDAYTNQGGWDGYTYSDMTYYTDPASEAGVFDSGTVNWVFALTPCSSSNTSCPSNTVGQITGNLLWLFGQGPAGNMVPSVANWQSVTPSGS
ncbi:MAG TPA: N,N-dimethylformamidase beta subunit family domain-containing protein, partial [Acidimicrobiales bacterium]|nr:N,N-dimethylformamidase beta subunit family domain-containing protein [Acidimicrobiales bacterium]